MQYDFVLILLSKIPGYLVTVFGLILGWIASKADKQ